MSGITWILRNKVAASLCLIVVLLAAAFPLTAGSEDLELCGWTIRPEDEWYPVVYYMLLMGRIFAGTFFGKTPPIAPPFEPNLGQFAANVRFASATSSWSFSLDNGGRAELRMRSGRDTFEIVALSLRDAKQPIALGEDLLPGRVNYLIGNDPSKWTTNVPQYGKVRYREVYPGIDAVHHFQNGRIETDFEVRPHADPRQIRVRLEGVKRLSIDRTDGSLIMLAPSGQEVRWGQTRIFQRDNKKPVSGGIRVLSDDTVGFDLGDYDRSQTLVIDPVLNYLSYAGRNGSEGFLRGATDANGNYYAVGATGDPAYPALAGTTSGPGVPTQGRPNAILAKTNADGSQILYTTHFGGTSADVASAITLDSAGNIYVTGSTSSPDYPVSNNAYQRTIPQGDKLACFVTKFNPSASAILYSTYFNGTGGEGCTGIALDNAGAIYIAGFTSSQNLPVTPDAFQTSFRSGGGQAVRGFITKFNSAGTSLIYSTYLGGSGRDTIFSLAVDAEGAAYVAGTTNSGGTFPVTQGAAQTTYGGSGGILDFSGGDAFAAKLSPDGSRLVYATYIGGRNDDFANAIAVARDGSAYVAGSTVSTNFPVTAGAAQTTYAGAGGFEIAGGDTFLVKLNPTGSAFSFATYLGGAKDERATSIVLDSEGNPWIAGHTLSENFPVTADAMQRRFGGFANDMFNAGDGFIARLSADGSKIVYGTYVGGSAGEYVSSLSTTRDGKSILFAGASASRNLPVSSNAAQRQGGTGEPAYAPFGDGMIGRIDVDAPTVAEPISVAQVANAASFASAGTVSPGMVIAIDGLGFRPESLQVVIGGINATVVQVRPTRIFAVVPSGVDGAGSVDLVVKTPAVSSEPVALTVVPALPGIFTTDGSGTGGVIAFHQDGTTNSPDAWAQVGTEVTILVTGEGKPGSSNITVRVGDADAEVLSVAPMPDYPAGYLAVRFRVTMGLASGEAPIVLKAGDVASQDGALLYVWNP
ncbi:hypothetical protein F183_A03420 [Bryobacterales bacterium F-183]|nr:hypothetical protein F183_A03420 [Bryobacterales bacterium F-183]